MYLILTVFLFFSNAVELIIGEEKVDPGIVFIFEGAVKDNIYPSSSHLSESQADVHIEARVNWDNEKIPEGAVAGGFIPYLHITALIQNSKTGLKTFVDLKPHINLIDNFHYARNIALPGSEYDLYSVTFNVSDPTYIDLSYHKDWIDTYGEEILKNIVFSYENIFFGDICKASRY